jgi:hypothetical protein
MSTANEEKEQSLFERLYEKGKEALKGIQKPLVKASMKRLLEGAYDDLSKKIHVKTIEVQNEMTKLDNLSPNVIVEAELTIRDHQAAQEILKEKYKELFDKELVREED